MIIHPPDSGYAQEMGKWEAQPSMLGTGLRPYVKHHFPMMLHRVGARPQGGLDVVETVTVGNVTCTKEGLPISGQDDESMRRHYYALGFRDTPLEALEAFEAEQLEHARLAAEREYDKQKKLSPRAAAEVQAIEDESGARHLPMIPETPIAGKPDTVTHINTDGDAVTVQMSEIQRQRFEQWLAEEAAQKTPAPQKAKKPRVRSANQLAYDARRRAKKTAQEQES